MLKRILAVVATIVAFAAIYFVGVISTSFSDGRCYSEVIDGITAEAKRAIKAGGPAEDQKFEGFINSLPVSGYETNVSALRSVVRQYRSKNGTSNS